MSNQTLGAQITFNKAIFLQLTPLRYSASEASVNSPRVCVCVYMCVLCKF
jgi:hypothetical protein